MVSAPTVALVLINLALVALSPPTREAMEGFPQTAPHMLAVPTLRENDASNVDVIPCT
jgi:hypothetical protein